MLALFGYGVAAFLFFGMLYRTAFRWRYLADIYAAPFGEPIESRSMQSAVLIGLYGYSSHKGIVTIGLHPSGVSFRIMPIFSLFHAPIFVPYSDIQGWETSWYLDAPSTQLDFVRAPDVKMVMPTEQAEWLRRYAGQRMRLSTVPSPAGKVGQGWRVFNLVHLSFAMAMLGMMFAVYIVR